MPSTPITPLRRDLLLALLVLLLLAAPLWTPALQLDERTHNYDGVEVVVDDGRIELAEWSPPRTGEPISEEIMCTGQWQTRPCGLESLLLEAGTAPSGVRTTNPDWNSLQSRDPYRYVQLDDGVYETTYEANESAQDEDGLYPIEMGLEPSQPDAVLRDVSLRPDTPGVPDVVERAAREGSASSERDVRPPATPIRLEDGSYYRVYRTRSEAPPSTDEALHNVLFYGGFLFGILGLLSIRGRFSIVHVGDGSDADGRG